MATRRQGKEEKAVRLILEKKVERIEKDVHVVQGDSGTYEVRHGRCQCDAASFGSKCSHALAVGLFEMERQAEIKDTRKRMAAIEVEVSALQRERAGLENHLHELETPKAELEREKRKAEERARREAQRVKEEARKRANGEELEFQL